MRRLLLLFVFVLVLIFRTCRRGLVVAAALIVAPIPTGFQQLRPNDAVDFADVVHHGAVAKSTRPGSLARYPKLERYRCRWKSLV